MARDYRESSNYYRYSTPTIDDTLFELREICLDIMLKTKWPHLCAQFSSQDGFCTVCFAWKNNA